MTVLLSRTATASLATLSGLAVAVGLAHAVAPGWTRAIGLDVWNAPAADAEYRRTLAAGEQLDDTRRRLRAQVAVTDGLAADLATGRLSVAEAADEVARVNAGRWGFEVTLAAFYPAVPTFRERVARYAIDRGLRRLAETDPSDARRARDRLEAEYQELQSKP